MADVKTFPITGIPKAKNAVWNKRTDTIPYVENIPVRREITEWFGAVEDPSSENGPELKRQWTLFILGLEAFEKMPICDQLSYFRVAGIHGYPLQPWDHAPKPVPSGDKAGSKQENGYCHHNTVAFPTWHRPYMMLFEQIIWMKMCEIIDGKGKELKLDASISEEFEKLDDTEKEKWRDAASNWRFPYWDWATKQAYKQTSQEKTATANYVVPQVCAVDRVPIWVSKGETLHPNPLARFENPDKDSEGKPCEFGKLNPGNEQYNISDDGVDYPDSDPDKQTERLPWSECRATGRYGIFRPEAFGKFTGLDGVNNWQIANDALALTASNFYRLRYGQKREKVDEQQDFPTTLGDAVARMFTLEYNPTWGEFASTKWYNEGNASMTKGFLSLEYIHNNMHNLTGGSNMRVSEKNPVNIGLGHMCDVPVAAFDPIFWLHHCNVDRLTAMWQVLNWGKWFDTEPENPDNVKDFSRKAGLEPFHMDTEKTVWTSDACRDWTVGGYTYTDLVPPEEVLKDGSLSEVDYMAWLRYNINKKYKNTSTAAQSLRDADKSKAIFGNKVGAIDYGFVDYVINVVYDRYALDGRSYSIRFYLQPDVQIQSFSAATSNEDNFIGEVYNFAGMPMPSADNAGCDNCKSQQQTGDLSTAQVALTIPLLALADNEDFREFNTVMRKDIKPYLQEHLHYKYVGHGGVEYSEELFPKTRMYVVASTATSVPATRLKRLWDSLPGAAASEDAIYSTPRFGTENDFHKLVDVVGAQRRRKGIDMPEPMEGISMLSINQEEDESLWEW